MDNKDYTRNFELKDTIIDGQGNYWTSPDIIKRINNLFYKQGLLNRNFYLKKYFSRGIEGIVFETQIKGILCKIIPHKIFYRSAREKIDKNIFTANNYYEKSLYNYEYLSEENRGPKVFKIIKKKYLPWEQYEKDDLQWRINQDLKKNNLTSSSNFIDINGFPISIVLMEEINCFDQGYPEERLHLINYLYDPYTIQNIGATCDLEFGRNRKGRLVLLDIMPGQIQQEEIQRWIS